MICSRFPEVTHSHQLLLSLLLLFLSFFFCLSVCVCVFRLFVVVFLFCVLFVFRGGGGGWLLKKDGSNGKMSTGRKGKYGDWKNNSSNAADPSSVTTSPSH